MTTWLDTNFSSGGFGAWTGTVGTPEVVNGEAKFAGSVAEYAYFDFVLTGNIVHAGADIRIMAKGNAPAAVRTILTIKGTWREYDILLYLSGGASTHYFAIRYLSSMTNIEIVEGELYRVDIYVYNNDRMEFWLNHRLIKIVDANSFEVNNTLIIGSEENALTENFDIRVNNVILDDEYSPRYYVGDYPQLNEAIDLDYIIDTTFTDVNKVSIPSYINRAVEFNTNVWSFDPFIISYLLRVTDSIKWALDQLLINSTEFPLIDVHYGIYRNVKMRYMSATWAGDKNFEKPWEIEIELISII